jgi:AGCS family alanine or glycine:cation symporter
MRGLLSNEAGCGTAPLAHSAANTKSPVEQGFWGIFEVFVDTIILCTMTALVIIVSVDCNTLPDLDGINLTIVSYSQVMGKYAGIFIALSVLFFGFATILCWAYYGLECIAYLTKRKVFSFIYVLFFVACIIYGSVIAPQSIWGMADFAIGIMTSINIIMLIFMRRELYEMTANYFKNKTPNP